MSQSSPEGRGPRSRDHRRAAGLFLAAGALAATIATGAYAEVPAQPATTAELEQQVATLREQLRVMQEQQRGLTETLGQLQQKLASQPAAAGPQLALLPSGEATSGPQTEERHASFTEKLADRYQDGIVIWQTEKDASIPFLLRFNVNTQVRYLNTTSGDETFTDHLGVVRGVNERNDITVNRSMFILGGYIFDPRLRYSSTVWTSAGSASIVVAGTIGWQFSDALTLTGGYTGVPGSRSLVNTFPFFQATDRSMADNFFRPGFTQGIWANGDLPYDLHYLAFVGNGLNTLNVSAAKIDDNLMGAASLWWEPLGDYGPPGKSRNMYDDYYASDDLRIRLGASATWAREDRFSDLDQSSPENTSLHNSDGVLTFSTGAFAPDVTVDEATYKMVAVDWGAKWRGLSINGQYYFRWVDDFLADGPIPIDSMFDHGFELSAAAFVVPRKLMAYGRGSMVFGQFRDSWEAAIGAKWYFLPTERMWLNAELMRVVNSPYGGTFTPYTAGLTAWVPMVQAIVAF